MQLHLYWNISYSLFVREWKRQYCATNVTAVFYGRSRILFEIQIRVRVRNLNFKFDLKIYILNFEFEFQIWITEFEFDKRMEWFEIWMSHSTYLNPSIIQRIESLNLLDYIKSFDLFDIYKSTMISPGGYKINYDSSLAPVNEKKLSQYLSCIVIVINYFITCSMSKIATCSTGPDIFVRL